MLAGVNRSVWMEERGDEGTTSWGRNNENNNINNEFVENKDEMGSLSTFRSLLEVGDEEWYLNSNNNNNNNIQGHHDITFAANFTGADDDLLLPPVDSSSSCSASPASVFTSLDQSQVPYFLPPNPTMPSVLNVMSNNPLENSFNLGCENGFLEAQALGSLNTGSGLLTGFTDLSSPSQMASPNLSLEPQFSTTQLLQLAQNNHSFGSNSFQGFGEASGSSLILNRSKLLKPLDNFASTGSQPTLFQKRAALRKNLPNNGPNLGVLGTDIVGTSRNAERYNAIMDMREVNEKKKGPRNREEVEDLTMDGSDFNYDSDGLMENDGVEESGKHGGNSSNPSSNVTGGDQKGKKKGVPAKNLLAERKRRKKLNDRLFMLRSVVPNISKMDRASILGDAIEYLQELRQKINDLQKELDSSPPGSSLTPTTTPFYPLTPTPSSLPSHIKEELCPSSVPSHSAQPARVEVLREGRAVNIHMFCGKRPGLLLSTMRTLDNLGLDIQQAVISCFNGFALDIFRAEQCREGLDINTDQIKAELLNSAGFQA